MIKKIFFSFLMLVSFFTSATFAVGFNTLKFTYDSGKTYSVDTDDLELIIEGENLSFNNTDFTIPLSSLLSMEFIDHYDAPAAVDALSFDCPQGRISVYNLKGTFAGSFDSFSQALNSLGEGVFVIKGSNGETLKVNVGK